MCSLFFSLGSEMETHRILVFCFAHVVRFFFVLDTVAEASTENVWPWGMLREHPCPSVGGKSSVCLFAFVCLYCLFGCL